MTRGDSLLNEISRLASEVETVKRAIVLPGWNGPQHGMPDTLYGYMMGVFARIDLFSAYWRGSFAAQSSRMTDFIASYMSVGRLEASLALQFWRHKLMHTSAPRELIDPKTGVSYRWLLHWGDEHLPRSQHFQLQSGTVLGLSLDGLIDNIHSAARRYLAHLVCDPSLQANYDSVEHELRTYPLRIH